jgi:hypothetical protein
MEARVHQVLATQPIETALPWHPRQQRLRALHVELHALSRRHHSRADEVFTPGHMARVTLADAAEEARPVLADARVQRVAVAQEARAGGQAHPTLVDAQRAHLSVIAPDLDRVHAPGLAEEELAWRALHQHHLYIDGVLGLAHVGEVVAQRGWISRGTRPRGRLAGQPYQRQQQEGRPPRPCWPATCPGAAASLAASASHASPRSAPQAVARIHTSPGEQASRGVAGSHGPGTRRAGTSARLRGKDLFQHARHLDGHRRRAGDGGMPARRQIHSYVRRLLEILAL